MVRKESKGKRKPTQSAPKKNQTNVNKTNKQIWEKFLNKLKKNDIATIIPGKGSVDNRENLSTEEKLKATDAKNMQKREQLELDLTNWTHNGQAGVQKSSSIKGINLMYTSAGDKNFDVVSEWVKNNPNFDLWVTFYGDDDQVAKKFEKIANYFVRRKGQKFTNLKTDFKNDPKVFEKYSKIAIWDDDLMSQGVVATRGINRLFEIMEEYPNIKILQPSFENGKISYPITKKVPGNLLHYVNFIEMNAPIFRTSELLKFLKVFDVSVKGDWGVDFWYMNVLGPYLKDAYAVVDQVSVFNPEHFDKEWREKSKEWEKLRDSRGLKDIRKKHQIVYKNVKL